MTKHRRLHPQRRPAVLERLEPRVVLAGVPVLHSFPESEHKLFLDFDGHVTEGVSLNQSFAAIHSPPFDVDGVKYDEHGVPDFSDDEISRMVSIWERMAEDFLPFNLDVTTEDPSVAEPDIFAVGGRAQRIVFTSKFDEGPGGTGERWFEPQSLGFAHESWALPRDTPAWVFSTHALAGEIGSHEAGHTFGLGHDGYLDARGQPIEYRGEHGSGETTWSPIMGAGNKLSQWSDGQYPNATNTMDHDIGFIVNAVGRRPDDYIAITPLVTEQQSVVDVEGFIGTEGDKDIFSFTVDQPDTRLQLSLTPWHNGPNLDIGVSLYGLSSGLLIGFDDPIANPIDRLASSVDIALAPDTYYLSVDGVGKAATPDDPGYPDYGSLGYYRITGSIGQPVLRGDINADGILSATDIDTLYTLIGAATSAGTSATAADLNEDGEINQADVDVLVREVLRTEYGDFNLDGRIDFADFLALASNFDTNDQGWAHGDATGDGRVDSFDFDLLAGQFGYGLVKGTVGAAT